MQNTDVCPSCIHYRYKPPYGLNGPIEDSGPGEEWCQMDMDNFELPEGCYLYERGWLK